jgi:hypothetical protein
MAINMALATSLSNPVLSQSPSSAQSVPTPVDIQTYAGAELPFFDIFNEVPTNVHVPAIAFKELKTVSEIWMKCGIWRRAPLILGAHISLQKCQCQANMLGCVYVWQIYAPLHAWS